MPQDNFQKTGNSSPGHGQSARTGRELIAATRPYVEKSTVKSWWLSGSTFGLMLAALTAAGMLTWWPLRVMFSILGALLMVRAFIIFHDYLHGAILKGSRVAR